MKVLVQTKITPRLTVYDSKAPKSPTGNAIKDAALRFFDPVIAVTDDRGNVLYQTGDFYESRFPLIAGGIALVGLLFILRRVL